MKKYIVLCALFAFYGCGESSTKTKQTRIEQAEADKMRLEKWAYIAKEKQITQSETVRMVIFPDPLGKYFDTKCLIYINHEFRQSSMVCPEIDKFNIAEDIR